MKFEQQSSSCRVRAGVRMTVDGTVGVDVVLHDGVVEDDRPDQGQVLTYRRLRRHDGSGGAELRVGVGAPGNGLPDVQTQGACGADGHHDLVGPVRVGHAPLDDGHPVLREEEAAHASIHVHVGVLRRLRRLSVTVQGFGVHAGVAGDVAHVGQAGDLGDQRAVVAVGVSQERIPERGPEAEVGGVGAGQERRERRLRAPGRRQRTHGQTADEPDQEHEGQIGPPAAPEGGPEAIARDPDQLPGHLAGPRDRRSFTSKQSPHANLTLRLQSARRPHGGQGG